MSGMRNQQLGFSLIESLVSLLLFSLAVVGATGLQGSIMGFQQNAQYRAEASFYAEQLIGLATADAANVYCYALDTTNCANSQVLAVATAWRDTVQEVLPGAAAQAPAITYNPASAEFNLTIFWQRPADDIQRNHTVMTVIRP
jgi:type IV pilus assembly protein PilV